MARTIFEQVNQTFSDKAHRLARQLIYPQMFGGKVRVKDTCLNDGNTGKVMDGEMGIDRIIYIRPGIPFSVQERFRRHHYSRNRDITITQRNRASGQWSELHKSIADYFIYGYLNESETDFIEAVAVHYRELRQMVARRQIGYQVRENQKGQVFITIPFTELEKKSVVSYHYTPTESKVS